MRVADVGQYSDVGARDFNQRRDVAEVASAHFDDDRVVLVVGGVQAAAGSRRSRCFHWQARRAPASRIAPSKVAANALVVVFPALPVIPSTQPSNRRRANVASAM